MRNFFFTLLVSFTFVVYSQVENNTYGVGNWQIHSSYASGYQVAVAGNKIYCNARNGLFFYDKDDNSINTFSTIDGLSDTEIGTIAYSESQNALVIGYTNGNIDILKKNKVYNVTGIKESINISGSKNINHITTQDQFAYLSCDFGLVKLDLDKIEIKDSYLSIGSNGASPAIYQSEIVESKDSIFLVSSDGVFGASLLPNFNLSDFNNWFRYDQTNGIDTNNLNYISSLNDTVYVYSSTDGLFYKNGQNWFSVILSISDKSKATNLDHSNGELFLSFEDTLGTYKITSSKDYAIFSTNPENPYHFQYDQNNTLWAADKNLGLVRMNGVVKDISIKPDGPNYIDVFRMFSVGNQVFALSGGYRGTFVGNRNYERGLYKNQDFKWTNYGFSGFSDLIDMDYNTSDGFYYVGSFKNGLIQWDGKNVTNVYNQFQFTIENGDTIRCPLVPYANGFNVRVPDVTVDNDGNTWVCNHLAKTDEPTPLHKLSKDGKWTSYTFTNTNATAPVKLVIDQLGTKWITLKGNESRKGGYVFNDKFDLQKYLSESSVGLPSSTVTVMKVDKSNNVWIGTVKGIAVAKDVGNVFLSDYKVDIPIFGDRPLLEDEFINDIAIDGGNRIWIATTNGAFLLSPGGEEVLLNFTDKNSFLNSNNVSSISINEKTGEVFFGTEKGIISFWGSATEATEKHESVEIFPNPIRPEFDGVLGVRGLANNAVVKFTDVSGNLVFETDAAGGMAIWNMRDVNGNEVSSGVYLIFSSSIDGEDAFVGKVAVIR